MTTNAEIKAMFQQIMVKQTEILAAADAPLPAALNAGRVVRTMNIDGNMVEFAPDDVWMKFAMVQTIPGDPTRGKPFTRLMFRYANLGRMFSVDLWGTPEEVTKRIGGIEPEVVEAIQPYTVMLRVPSTVAPTVAETLAVSAKGPTVTEADGTVWTIATSDGNKTMRNGEWFGGGQGSEYAIVSGVVYVLGSDNNWYVKTATGWTGIGSELPTS